ncbi:8665_t:CDS:2 [Cetraspora pellucida]|uniref:8665_t:CDS:1 n=1 Tax=Cetraspora pellucida TaxID=1433469 RepID=A0ACA9K2T5_9GLOM|nr:8665_t:CDS:2 [Cetraspora pellucida]
MLFSNINSQAKGSKGTDFTHKKHNNTEVHLDESNTTLGYVKDVTKKRRSRSDSVKSNSQTQTETTLKNNEVIPMIKQVRRNSRLLNESRIEDEEGLGTPINIYQEHRGHLEQDKKARTELDIQILKDDLYDPVLETPHHSNKKQHNLLRNTSIGNFVSFLPSKIFGGYGVITESGRTDVWNYYPNEMFTSGVTMDGVKGVCCS